MSYTASPALNRDLWKILPKAKHTHTHPPTHTHTHTHTQKGDRDRKSALDVPSSSASVSPFSALGHREQGHSVLNLLSPATCKQLQTPVLSLGLEEGEQNSIHDLWSWRLPFSLFKGLIIIPSIKRERGGGAGGSTAVS